MNDSPIDDPKSEKQLSEAFSVIGWWEKKRIVYNLILILFELFFYSIGTREISRFIILETIAAWGFITVGANLIFCGGWGSELLLRYYFPKIHLTPAIRTVLFAGGIIVSIGVVFVVSHMIFLVI